MIESTHILIALFAIAASLLAVAAYGDIMTRRISNRLSGGLALIGGLYGIETWITGTPFTVAVLYPLLTATALFLIGLFLFAFSVMGGGDVKLMAAFGLIAGPALTPAFLVITALLGGVLALVMLLAMKVFPAGRLSPSDGGEISAKHTVTIPYGVAIAGAGLWVCLAQLSPLIA